MANKIQIRRDVAANWTSSNPTLSQGEQGYETDTGKIKIGDGSTAWTSLGYSFEGGSPDLYADNYDGTSTLPSATGTNAVAIGLGAVSSGLRSVAIGNLANASSLRGFAVGVNSAASGSNAISMGANSASSGGASVAIGGESSAASDNSFALGYQAKTVTGSQATAVGYRAYASGTGSFAAATGDTTSAYGATGQESVAIGKQAKATGIGSLALSANRFGPATSTSNGAVAIGDTVTASGSLSLAMGYNTTASASSAIAIGSGITNSTANQVVLGGTTQQVKISDTYTLPTSDGTNGQVLTTDGSGAVTFADAGGGGADLFAENYDGTSTLPSATGTNAVAIGGQATATNSDAFSFGYNARAQGQFSTAIGASALAGNSLGATAIGFTAVSQGTSATALGDSYASGADSFAAAIANNTSSYGATGANSVAIGELAKATGTDAIAIGASSTASGSQSFAAGFGHLAGSARTVVLGYQSSATSTGAIAIGNSCASSQGYAISLGNGASAAIYGKMAHAADTFAAQGDAQSGQLVLNAASTDATPVVMTSNGLTGFLSSNQIILPNNSAYSFSGTIIARESAAAGSDYASWEIKGALLRDANAASTVLGNGIKNKLYASAGASAWDIALTADTTNGGLAITVTGAASTNIRWVATVNTSEVTYA